MGCKSKLMYPYIMYDSIYEMVYQELVEDGDKFKDLTLPQKQFVAEKLTTKLLLADSNHPLSFEEAGRQLDDLYVQALEVK